MVIATPDHWHALMFVEACRAGKDVYVEKPLSLTVAEGRRMVEVAAETKRVTQVGTNRRSWKAYEEAAEFIRSGGIGKVTMARAFSIRNEWPIGLGMAQGPAPSDWEWDHWLGPAPYVPYDPNRQYLQLPLVLQLLGRAVDQLRGPLHGRDPLVPRPGLAEIGRGHGRALRRYQG